MQVEWLGKLIDTVATTFGTELFVVKAVLAIVLVCLLCGAVGAIVVGNRMAFFSDAMAHCALAGLTLGALSVVFSGAKPGGGAASFVIPLVMVLFGAAVGAAMVYVRENSSLSHDTVIGVFFALAIGFGAMLLKIVREVSTFDPEGFMFGSLFFVADIDLVFLLALLAVVAGLFAWQYNQIVFASFNPSLARTRRIRIRLNNYLFIVLLALVVNLSIKAVGALLINALLVVPAAAAALLARNLRQMFWLTIVFCVGSGLVGLWASMRYKLAIGGGRAVEFGPSGTIVVTAVGLFFAAMAAAAVRARFAPVLARPHAHAPGEPCSADGAFGQCPH
jgi:zinc transport system permease protein